MAWGRLVIAIYTVSAKITVYINVTSKVHNQCIGTSMYGERGSYVEMHSHWQASVGHLLTRSPFLV